MKSTKLNSGNYLEDFLIGQVIHHPTPRTITAGERALYTSLYPSRHALYSSDEFARNCGLKESPIQDLIVFHVIFGKTVPEISLNAVANLGYAQGRFYQPVYCGDTINAISEVIGLKENSNRKTGIVWVKTSGYNQNGKLILEYIRWVMVRKKHPDSLISENLIPKITPSVDPKSLHLAGDWNFSNYDFDQAGEPYRLHDYKPGEIIDHIDGITIEETEHILATRLWQNTARVHFDNTVRGDSKRLIYGGHLISMAKALSFNGLANAQSIVGINNGSHTNPCFAGDTIRAWSEVEYIYDFQKNGIGAIKLRTFITKGEIEKAFDDNQKYDRNLLLDFSYWALIPT